MKQILSAVIQKITARPNRTARKAKEVEDGGNAEQADAKNDNKVEEQDHSDLRTGLRK